MAIVDMTKFNLISFDENRKVLLDELQRFQDIHFSETGELAEEAELENVSLPKSIQENEDELNRVKWLLDLLEPRLEGKSALKELKEGLDWYTIDELKEKGSSINIDDLYDSLKELTGNIELKSQKIKEGESLLEDLRPWISLDSPLEDIKSNSRVKMLTGTIPNKNLDECQEDLNSLEGTYLDIVSKDNKQNYVIAIILDEDYSQTIEILRKNGFNNSHIPGKLKPAEEIQNIEEKNKLLKSEIEELNKEIDAKTSQLKDLEIRYEYLANQRLELSASEKFVDIEGIDYIEGYVPSKKVAEFTEALNKALGKFYYLELEDVDKQDDSVPVLLENGKLVEPFQDLTSMYSTPRYSEVDPTPYFFFFYWVFFGMMVADLGYGILMTIATGIALKTFNLSESMRRKVKFFFMLSISTIIWGLIYGSAFGISLPYEPLVDTSNYMSLLILSLVMGGVHLFFALGVQGFIYIRDKQYKDAVYDVLFWYMAIIGVILLLLGLFDVVGPGVAKAGKIIMIIGMVGIVLFGGREAKGLPKRLVLGLYELYGISSWLGDFISYARLMALGLAGGFIAVAINMIISMLPKGIVGFIAGVIIFLAGHAFNLFLSYLSAYVHDIRLAYVEFFGKFFEGGGKEFNRFKNDTKYINLK